MKYIKHFEEIHTTDFDENMTEEDLPKINDFVLCKMPERNLDRYTDKYIEEQTILKNFINNNIGQIVDLINIKIIVKYENVPEIIKNNFPYTTYLRDIIYFSDNQEELKVMLDQNKFNL